MLRLGHVGPKNASPPRAICNKGVALVRTSSMKFSFQPQPRRFMAMLSLSGCCFSKVSVNRLSQAEFSRTWASRMRGSQPLVLSATSQFKSANRSPM